MPTRREVMLGGLTLAAAGMLPAVGEKALAAAGPVAASSARAYRAGSAERKLEIINLYDLEEEARKLIPKPQFGYISSGAGDEWTLKENVRAFDDYRILPRYLAGVKEPDTSAVLLGSKVDIPIFVPPMADHGLAHATAEAGTARGAAAAGALFTAATLANVPLEEIAKAGSGPKWFQLYYARDMGINRELIRRARDMGATAIVFTVDLEWAGNREADRRNGFAFPPSLSFPNVPNAPKGATLAQLFTVFKRDLDFSDLDFIAKESGLPVVVKGVLTVENARECVDHGAAAIQVSNHGGRQLDTVPGSVSVLAAIVEAVGGKVPVYLDGGVRRGVHVFKALALGAKAVAVGRPVQYGLALGGAQGVASVMEVLETELKLAMKLSGCGTLADISRKYVS